MIVKCSFACRYLQAKANKLYAWNEDDTPWNRWEMLNACFELSIVTLLPESYLLHVSVTVTSEKQIHWTNVVSWRKH